MNDQTRLLPVEFRHGREKPAPSYEFYNTSIVARQLDFGQFPPRLFFADKLKPREVLTQPLEFPRILQFEQAQPHISAEGWKYGPFSSNLFNICWQEWAQHLFCRSSTPYCLSFDLSFQPDTDVTTSPILIVDSQFSRCSVYPYTSCRTLTSLHQQPVGVIG